MFVTSILILKILLLNSSLAEWIDMPQFSSEKKIYRIPTIKQDHFYKFAQKNVENQFLYTYQDIIYKDAKTKQTAVNESGKYNFHNMENNMKKESTVFDQENVLVFDAKKYNYTAVPSMTKEGERNKQYLNESFTFNDAGLLNYLPVDILRNVHYTLKSQPTSTDGKIQFLKTFENTLMIEIESQLAESITVVRKRRSTEHYDHSYDHEHAAGFPSIEGALMAISFLTFAVYLVRLVMVISYLFNFVLCTLFYNLAETGGGNIGSNTALRYEPNGRFNERFCNCTRICVSLTLSTWYTFRFSCGTKISCVIRLDIVVLTKSIDKE